MMREERENMQWQVTHVLSPESQPNPQTSQQPSPGQPPSLASSDSNDRNRANKTGYPALYDRDKAALEWDTHAQSKHRIMNRNIEI